MNTIKKLTLTFITAIVMLTVIAPVCKATTGTITVDLLRVRKSPNTSAEVVRNLELGDEVEILSEEEDWYKIELKDGTEAYIYAEYVELVEDETTEEEVEENEEIEETNYKKIEISKNTNIYILPALFSNFLTKTTSDATVDVLEEINNWVKVEYKGTTGWILNKEKQSETKTQEISSEETSESTVTEEESSSSEESKLEENEFGYVNVTSAFVRKTPSTTGVIVQSLYLNNKVTILDEENGWYKIETSEGTGYIFGELISANQTTTSRGKVTSRTSVDRNVQTTAGETRNVVTTQETKKVVEEVEQKVIKTAYVNASALNVREEASKSSEVIKVLKQKAKIEILAETGEWYKIKLDSENGYVMKTYIVDSLDKVVVKTTPKTTTPTSGIKVVANGTGSDVATYAKQFLGSKYVYGGSGPYSFDCSGLVMYVYKKFGVNLPHNAVTQANYGTKVSKSELQPGDILIFRNQANTSIGHSAIYIGDGKFVHAANSKRGVTTDTFNSSYYSTRFVEGRRLI